MRYDPHDRLSAPARPSASLMRLGIGVVVFGILSYVIGTLILSLLIGVIAVPVATAAEIEVLVAGRTPGAVLVLLLNFTGYIAALAIVMRVVHRREVVDLIGPLPVALRQGGRVVRYLVLIMAVALLLPDGGAFAMSPNRPLPGWLLLLPLAMLALLVQVGAEELFFRGYLQSQLAARFSNPVIWIWGPSILFGLLHYDTGIYGENAMIVAVWAVLFGAIAADLTARSGTLGPAIALHLVNNAAAFLIATPVGFMDGLALYTYPLAMDDPAQLMAWLPVEALLTLTTWLAARLALRR